MELRFSDDFIKAIEFSRDEALRTGWHCITPDHIMLGILRHRSNSACECLERAGVCLDEFKGELDDSLFTPDSIPWEDREEIRLCDSAESFLRHAAEESLCCGDSLVTPLHFVLACSHIAGPCSHDRLASLGISLRSLTDAAGIEWSVYGHHRNEVKEAAAPDPQILAAAIEKRLREGYTTDNFLAS